MATRSSKPRTCPLATFAACSEVQDFSADEIEFVDSHEGILREDGFLPDEQTAIRVAEIILVRIYGREILDRRPFVAHLVNGETWYIKGSVPGGADGGVPYLVMRKKDGMILKVMHPA